ncbi:MAG: hypothetical protein IPJ65_19095 [Archangiaceae bacterium]|nr:hypothetical protein [Archangiaceae bacterium]
MPPKSWSLLLSCLAALSFSCGDGMIGPEDELAPDGDMVDADDDSELGVEADELAGRPCGVMRAGDRLTQNEVLHACSGQYWLALQGDGNLVLYANNPVRARWSTRTFVTGVRLEMQGDGNLVLYQGTRPLWASNTSGHPGAMLAMQDDGNLVLYQGGRAIWATHTNECGVMYAGGVLRAGSALNSCDRRFRLVMQGDDNLVLYQGGKALWATGTVRSGSASIGAYMQGDGNLVVRRNGTALWQSHTAGHAGARLLVRNDGTVVVAQGGTVLFRAPNALPPPPPPPPPSTGVPASLLAYLGEKPYVEQSCSSTTYPGWSHPALRCSYSSGGLSSTVVTATPSAARVGQWVVDSANLIPSLKALRTSSPAYWEQGLKAIASRTLIASGRIFPLEGGIIELDQEDGVGYQNYHFTKGVTTTCGSGCWCRINSLHRTVWCGYRSGTGKESYGSCLNRLGSSGYGNAWGNECMNIHSNAWDSTANESFRAQAWTAAQNMRCRTPGSCSPADVVAAVREQYK